MKMETFVVLYMRRFRVILIGQGRVTLDGGYQWTQEVEGGQQVGG